MLRKSFESKKETVRLVTLLLAASVLLSACGARPNSTNSENSVSSEATESQSSAVFEESFESSVDISFDKSLEESEVSEEESSEAQIEASSEESSEESYEQSEEASEPTSETSEEEPTIEPSKLIPVLELDIGLYGDDELAIEYGYYYPEVPAELCVRGNEILIYDYGNRRLLLYRDGKPADVVDVEKELLNIYGVDSELLMVNCAFNDEYYYIFQPYAGCRLFAIDRKTKEFTVLEHDIKLINLGSYDCDFIIINSEIYLDTYYVCYPYYGDTRYYHISGKTVTNVEDPFGYTLESDKRNLQIVKDGEKISLQRSPDCENSSLEGNLKDGQYLVSSARYTNNLKPNGYGSDFRIFCRYDGDGNLTGRYLWKKHVYMRSRGYILSDDGELYVITCDVNMRDTSKGKLWVNRVEFGMDEPFNKKKDYEPDVTIELPPPENPSKLTPVIELGAGDGDYEVGFHQTMDRDMCSVTKLAVYKNEVALLDCMTSRLLIYKDGKLVDKINVGEFIVIDIDTNHYSSAGNTYCKFDDKYYYIVNNNDLFAIDRKTKEHTVLSMPKNDDRTSYYYNLIPSGTHVYLEKNIHTRTEDGSYNIEKSYYILDGTTLTEGDNPRNFETREEELRKYLIINGKEVELEYSPDWIYNYVTKAEGISSDGSYIVSSKMFCYHEESTENNTYHAFLKYNAEGKLLGRFVLKMPYYLGVEYSEYTFDENGELYAVIYSGNTLLDLRDPQTELMLGVYKVDIGMDYPAFPLEYLLGKT